MATRIRYSVNKSTGLLTTKPVMAGTDLVTVSLDPNTLTATLTGADGVLITENPLKETTLPRLKSFVKNFLIGYGAVFNDEVRQTRNNATTATTENTTTTDVA